MKFNFKNEMKEEITMETFENTMASVEEELNMYYEHLDVCINNYIKSNADIATDDEVNHLTFYTFSYAYLNYLYGLLKLTYNVLENGRETYLKGIRKFGMISNTMMFAYQYINAATIRYNSFDDICKQFENTFNEADEYLKNGCKFGMEFQKDKMPDMLPQLVIDSIEKMTNTTLNNYQ